MTNDRIILKCDVLIGITNDELGDSVYNRDDNYQQKKITISLFVKTRPHVKNATKSIVSIRL
jgi:hypothetical protein